MSAQPSTEEKFLENVIKEEAKFDEEASSLDDDQLSAVNSTCGILHTDISVLVAQHSTSQVYRLKRVQKLLLMVYSQLGSEVFLLCMLAASATQLGKLNRRELLPKLRNWRRSLPTIKIGLRDTSNSICEAHGIGDLIKDKNTDLTVIPEHQPNSQGFHKDTGPTVLTLDDIPGMQISLLADYVPQSVFNFHITQLIGFIQQFQRSSLNPQQLTRVIDLLQQYHSNCPDLQYIQLVYPWYGALPSIDIRIDSKIGWSANVQLPCKLAEKLLWYIRES